MKDNKPHITDRTAHLKSPFQLSVMLPAIEFSGVRTLEGVVVKANGEDLPPYFDRYEYSRSTSNYHWGRLQDNETIADIYPSYTNLARSILAYALEYGYTIEKKAQKSLPKWHHTLNFDFMVQFYQLPLSSELAQLPHDKFRITDRDIQTFICDFMLDTENFDDLTFWSASGKELRDQLFDQGVIKLPWHYWLIFATVGLGVLTLLIWLLYRPFCNLVKEILRTINTLL